MLTRVLGEKEGGVILAGNGGGGESSCYRRCKGSGSRRRASGSYQNLTERVRRGICDMLGGVPLRDQARRRYPLDSASRRRTHRCLDGMFGSLTGDMVWASTRYAIVFKSDRLLSLEITRMDRDIPHARRIPHIGKNPLAQFGTRRHQMV